MKKIISAIVSLMMLLNIMYIPSVANAANSTIPFDPNKANLSFVYLGSGATPEATAMDFPSTGPAPGEQIWIGVQFSNMSKLSDLFKSNQTGTAESGLNNMTLGVIYDSDILEPVITSAAKLLGYVSGKYPYDSENDEALYKYSGINRAGTNGLGSDSEPNAIQGTAKSYTENFGVNTDAALYADGGDSAPRVFQDNVEPFATSTVGDDPVIYGFFSFKVKSDATITPGSTVLQAGLGQNIFSMGLGSTGEGDGMALAWNKNESTDTATNLKNYFNITDKDGNPTDPKINLWPTTYTIEFYNSYDPDTKTYGTQLTGKDITGIKEGDTVAKTTDAKMPADSDFTNDDTTKYLSKPLKYIGADGNAHDFDPNTTVLNSTLFASDATDKTTLKVFAEWADGHTVTFHSKYPDNTDTTVTRTVSPNSPSAIKKTEEPTVGTADTDFIVPDGYVFDGWYTAENGAGTKIVFAEEGVDGTDVSAINDVYANWQPMYTVKFYQKAGDSTEIKTALQFDPSADESNRTITSSDLPTEDERGTIDGKRFDGWYYKVGTSGTETKFEDSTSLVVSDNVVIYGKWVDVVTVSFYDSKTDSVAASSWEVDKGKTVADLTASQTIPTKTDNDSTHKYFIGWKNKTDDSAVDFTDSTYTFNSDLEVYADYGDYYQIKYYNNTKDSAPTQFGDTVYVNPHSNSNNPVVTSSDIPSTSPTSTDPNKGFSKWIYYVNSTATDFEAGVTVTGNIDVYPVWEDLIQIKFDYNGGTLDSATDKILKIKPNTAISASENGSLSAPVPTRSYDGHNYVLKGWATSANSQTPDYTTDTINSTSFAAGTTLYAVWAVDPDSNPNDLATLTFDSVGGSTVSSITVYKGDTITAAQMPSNPTKGQYTFVDWFEAATLSNTTHVTAPITMNADKTAYAHWDYTAADAITITFNDNGATTAVSPASIKIAPNDSIGAAWPTDPAKTDNTFGGWYTDTSDESTKKTSSSTFAQSTTLNAKWVADITVIYDTNGGNNDGPGTVKKPAGDAYVDPTKTPTKNGVNGHPGYTFLGWNTEQNGSGTYIKAGNKTGSSDPLKYSDLVTGGASSVTLYAQWGALDSTGAPAPEQYAVTVTFDGNGTTQKPVTKEANPKNKYPQLGDSIGATNMPNNPERTDYTFAGWNTKADGTGTPVTGDTVFDTSLDGVKAVGNGTYTSTVYAQWTPATTATTVTVTFNKNTDGKGTDANPITKTIVSGDSLGAAMPADPTNGTYAFDAWYAGSVTEGKVTTSGAALTSSTPISATTTYYAKWTKMLVARMQTNTAVYTGSQIKPLFDIYEITWPDQDKPYVLGDPIATNIDPTNNSDYTITYFEDGSSVTEVKDVGTYTFKVALKDTSDLAIEGAAIAETDYEDNNKNRTSNFTVTPKLLTVKVDPDTQLQKAGATVPLAAVTIDGIASTDAEANVIEKKYYKWTPKGDSDTAIDPGELDLDTAPTAVAKYVLQVTVKSDNKNYKIDKVVSSKDGTPVLLYEKTATQTYPAFNILNTDGNIVPGTNIVYVIQANDPSASISVKPGKNDTGLGSALSLYDTDYTTSVTFDDAEHPTRSDYYTRVDKDTDYVEFTITPKNDTTILTAPTAGTGVTISGPDSVTAAYTVRVDLTKSGATPNDIKITTKAGTDTNAPTLDYNFHIQKLVEAKIVLNYGNSPYGEIMKADNIPEADKQKAKNAFDASDTAHGNLQFGTDYIPTLGITNVKYTTVAWDSYTKNYDKDDNAIFVYEASTFVEPGLKIYDELGAEVTNATYDRTLVVKKMSVGEPKYSDTLTDLDLSVSKGNNDTVFSLVGNIIRPDVYTMTYTYNYTDLNGTQQTLTDTRPVIVLSKRGDIQLTTDPSFNTNDSKAFATSYSSWGGAGANSLFAFRVCDLQETTDPTVNSNDYKQLVSDLSKYAETPYNQYYRPLPTN